MPLSTVLGAQSLVQPAVCTTAGRPASPYTGQAIYDTTITALLIWNGTAWTGTGGLQLVTTATCSSGGTAVGGVVTIGSAVSSVEVAGAFSATFDNYQIMVSGGVGSTDNVLNLRLGATTTDYYYRGQYSTYSSATVSGDNAQGTSSWVAGLGSANNLDATITVKQPFTAKNATYTQASSRSATNGIAATYGGYLANTTSYTAFTILAATGTITGGTIRVYGYQNS